MKYPRPVGASVTDFHAARAYELTVQGWLGPFLIANLDSPTKMDFYVPGIVLDVKERRRPLSDKWPRPNNCSPEDAFVVDELSVRRAIRHGYSAYFLLRDISGNRTFLVSLIEMLCADRIRLNREGSGGHAKAKWVLDLSQFKQLVDPEHDLLPTILADQVAEPWNRSDCIIRTLEESDGT